MNGMNCLKEKKNPPLFDLLW